MEAQKLDWKNLPFGYLKTDCNIRTYYKNGAWGKIEASSSEVIDIHMAATALHYGQQAFEGMKAYRGKDNKIRLFRWEENSKRLNRSAQVLLMPEVSADHYKEALNLAVQKNERFLPPYESGATLYIRPLLIGTGPEVGVKPANEYLFIIFVTPVGPYFSAGFQPVDFTITYEFDRAAPLGTGHVKAGGNYAAGLRAMKKAHNEGFASVIFLDAREKAYIDECGPANFFAIRDNTYITPQSSSILASITNLSLMDLARDFGMKVEQRPIKAAELATFEEVGACGTGAIITPIKKIVDKKAGKVYEYCQDAKPGPITQKLYDTLLGIQYGDLPDKFGWIEIVSQRPPA
jgi:branched-chain amino acid aminotransferase